MNLKILISDPTHSEIQQPDGLWIASGLHRRAVDLLRRNPTAEQAEIICRSIGDAVIIRLAKEDNCVVGVDAWRGITAGFELYYSRRRDGSILLSDHFRNILVEIPVAERSISDQAIIDHFLFRAVPAPLTYAHTIRRLGHGDHLSIDPKQSEIRISRFDAIDYRWKPGSIVDYLARLDEAFHETIGWCQEHDGLVTMFSGGVDSTLLLTYMNGRKAALFHAPESVQAGTPDPATYATQAAELLDVDLEIRRLKDGDNWVNIESNIDKAGLPQRVVQTVMYTQAYAGPGVGFIHGSRGDALFGAAGTRNAVLSARAGAYPLDILLRGAALISDRANGLLQSSRQLTRDPQSPLGWAAGMSSRGFTDYGIVSDAVGAQALQSRLARRVQYASTRLGRAWQSAGRLHRHLELAHWIDYWCEDSTTFLRQLALAHCKRAHLPFLSTPLVATAMSVPTHQRYHRNFAVKYLLKEALRRRLPSYPVDQKKGITSMRLPPTYRGRNRNAVWEEYGVPDFIPERHHENVKSFNNAISHNALTYSMLDKRVLRNPGLAGIAGTRVLEYRSNRWHSGFIRKTSEFMSWIISTAPLQLLMSAV